jgi:uncharacterized membrane protein YozB (DUF420 family)
VPQTRSLAGSASTRPRAARRRPAGTAVSARGNVLYRNSVWLFGVFALAMLVAFWPSYYSRLEAQPSWQFHAHGLALTTWVAMLVAQAWLIRAGNRATHRAVGKLSYVAAALVVGTTVQFAHFRAQVVPVPLDPSTLYFLTLVLMALAAFGVLYALAMVHRRNPARHSRYMIASLFPFVTPVTDRLIGRYAPALVDLVPAIGGSPVVGVVGFLLADAMLAGLSIWDWRVNRRADVFPVALAVLVLYHVSVMTFYRLPAWIAFGNWFVGLPLS